jgi:glycolate oxidase FAD binding subunit
VAVPPDGGALLVGLDGRPEQVEWQCAELPRLVGGLGATGTRALDGAERDEAWRVLAGLARGAFPGPAAVMKLGVLPIQVAEVMEQGAGAAQRSGLRAAFAAHAGVGIVSAALAGEAAEAGAVVAVLGEWRAMAAGAGGHALLEWAPLAVKERMPVWDPPGPAHRFMRRIKEQLDPLGILNPGRFPGDS